MIMAVWNRLGLSVCFPLFASSVYASESSASVSTTSTPTSSTPTASIVPSPASCIPSAIAPIAVPIHNVSMQGPRGVIVRRGAELSVGTPPQPLAFIISDQTNNTAVFDVHNQCYTDAGANYTRPNSTAAECFSFYGGAFNESRSSTWTNAGSYGALGVPEDSIVDFGPIAYGTDTLSLISNISTPRFPFVIDHGRTGYEAFFMNTVGLGINSTLLNTLISARKIPTRTWSMFNGFTGSQSQNQSNGILVLGGYDEAKIFGSVADNITIDMDFSPDAISSTNLAKCPATGMIITVSNMTLAWPNGTKASLMGSSAGDTLRGCVIPNYDYISMQSDMWETFVSLTDTQEVGRSNSPLSWFQNLVTAESAFRGDLIISVDPGLDITIPNHELVRSFVDINSDGEEYISNSSTRVMGLYAMDEQTADTMPAFGRTFLTGAYLMVDDDKQQFTLWQGQSSTEQKLVAHGPSLCPEPVPVSSSAAPSPTETSRGPGSTISKGGIAGIFVGLVFIIAICIGIGYFLARKSRRKQAKRDEDEQQNGKHNSLDSKEPEYQKPELSSDHQHQPPQEIPPGNNDGEATFGPHEMNGGNGFYAEMAGQWKTAEMAAGDEESALEMPGDGRACSELPSTPRSTRSKASVKKLPPTPLSNKGPQSPSGKRSLRLTTVPKRKQLPGLSPA